MLTKKVSNEIKLHGFNVWTILLRQFKNPLLLIFLVSTVVAYILGEKTEAFAIWLLMALSILLGFWNEFRAEKVIHDLLKKISLTTTVIRNGIKEIILVEEVQLGDISVLYPGSIVPADIKINRSQNLEINEAVLTGESIGVVKKEGDTVFMGTVVTGGSGEGKVITLGAETKFGKISSDISKVRPETEFQKGLRDFGMLLTKVAVITVIVIIAFNFLLGHSMVETVLFALTIAMGITPELLPLIVTIGLSYGAKRLAKRGIVVKQLVSMEDLGNMEVLCTDKTGTLTEGKVSLNSFLNTQKEKDEKVLDLALICNSAIVHKKILGDAIDSAIWEYTETNNHKIEKNFKKIMELPFDYENRFMSVVISKEGKNSLISKGSPEAILERCRLSLEMKKKFEKEFQSLQKDGFRVIALATKEILGVKASTIKEIKDLNFAGYLTFMDVPKKDIKEALQKFFNLGVKVKVLTGDSEIVAEKVCNDVGFRYKKVVLGEEIKDMTDERLEAIVWETNIFAKITPIQKTRIIKALKKGNHTIGFLGDGINDGPALHDADIGISVNSAVDVAKDAASVVLMRKNLDIIADGIMEGRRTFSNTIKYILMGTSSNFGNMLSMAVASLFLPFLPMLPIQVLFNDILYDISQLVIPTDNVDSEMLQMPRHWDIAYIKKFMLFFGPIDAVFDFITFGVMFYLFRARGSLFQTGWMEASLITSILVVMVIRTTRVPFFKSKPSLPLIINSILVIAFVLLFPYSPLSSTLSFTSLPIRYYIFLVVFIIVYLFIIEIGKIFLNKSYSKSKMGVY